MMMKAFTIVVAAGFLAIAVQGQAPAPAPAAASSGCISVANSIATVSPTYAAAVLQNADAIGLQAYQLAQPQPGILIQKTFLVPEETDFANFYIFLHRRYSLSAATTTLKALIALQTLPTRLTAVDLSQPGPFQTNLTGVSLNVTGTMLDGPCAPGNQQNIGSEKCFASITTPDVAACQSIVHGISNVLPPPYWRDSDLAAVLRSSDARAPLVVPACAINGKAPCPSRTPGQEVPTSTPICDATCSVSSCCREN